MESTLDLDPQSLQDRDDVAVQTETRTVTRSEFETARGLESHVTVGLTNDAGDVLVVSDGPRGWTLPAVPVDTDTDWAEAARRVAGALTGVDATLDDPVRLRRVAFELEDDDRTVTTTDVLVRATVAGRPIADEPTLDGEDVAGLLWADRIPEDGAAGVAADVRALRDRSAAR
ncbi:hypothetical protein ACFO5R_19005 [Halosolutus amylolyticus]|uniref:Nudix hydrolase domain-containing protein n=1 Tax=Halosolutus amylolyticus TaxID=2932267 RepID=A0ABD5PTY0_9EURY|nr:hypothetical protein [Halosolutus amylolyticus]